MTTPDSRAREAAQYLAALTKERDAYAAAADSMAAAHKVERDKHCNCEFEGDENTVQCTLHNAWAETLHEQAGFRRERDAYAAAADSMAAAHKVERDALRDAARLALDFVEFCWRDVTLNEFAEEKRAATEAALKAVL